VRTRALALLAAILLVGCGASMRSAAQDGVDSDPWESLRRGWSALNDPPFARAGAVSVWTGTELFYRGGSSAYDATQHTDGALYDPAASKWRRIPDGPLGGRSSAGAVWTGKAIFVWGGWSGYGTARWNDGALFDPKSLEWQKLPPSSLSPRAPVAVVWTGREAIVWGDADRSDGLSQHEGAAYDPASDSWRELPRAPLGLNEARGLWTGVELIVFGALLDGNNRSDTADARGIAYDPDTGSWRVLASFPLSPQASAIAWTGKELIAWDYDMKDGAYDPNRDAWRRLPDVPLRFYECYPEGASVPDVVLAWFCGQGATFDLATSSWRRMPEAPGEAFGRPVAAGSIVLFAGAAHEESGNALWAYRP
jgi:hypothetical protein